MKSIINLCLLALTFCLACNPPSTEINDADQAWSKILEEEHRPLFHFSPDSMWMNDPNGMFFYEGEYHLFYQYYPDSTVWGPMHWGHAVSKDLVNWEDLPIALYPDQHGLIFSGSAVVDWNNSSGFGEGDQPPLLAIFTYHLMEGEKAGSNDFQTQGIAYSLDKGRTWSKYEGNPVLANPGIRDFRDPKVFWHEDTEQWVMIFAAGDRVKLYNSPDLKNWTFSSDFGMGLGNQGRPWECPDLFELEVEGSDQKKWVMLVSIGRNASNGGSGTQYFVGDFDGKNFSIDESYDGELWVDWGKDNYAGVTWSDIPAEDGRRIFIGWMSNWQYATRVPTEKWRSAMTIPRVLKLKASAKGPRLFSEPIAEIKRLREKPMDLAGLETIAKGVGELVLDFDTSVTDTVGIELENTLGENLKLAYVKSQNRYFVDRRNAGKSDFSEAFAGIHYANRESSSNSLKMHIFIDRASIELFAEDGAVLMTEIFFPNEDFSKINILGATALKKGQFYSFKPSGQ